MLPSLSPQTQVNTTQPPAPMRSIVWAINPTTGSYDIFNQFTADGNDGNLQVIQSKILITLSTAQGEWAAQPDFGVNYSAIYQNSDNPDIIAQVLVNEILTVQNVNNVSVNDLNYTATTRVLDASFNVNTLYGATQVIIGQANAG